MIESKPTRAAIYARQSVQEEHGIAQQVEDCREKAEKNKWSVVEVYKDNDTSATKLRDEQTDWARMLRDLDDGKFDVIIVTAVDRLMRRISDVIEIRPPKRHVRVVVVSGDIDTEDPMGFFILSLFVLVAENEIDRKERRAIPYRAARRAAGHPTAGRVPYGYEWVPQLHRDAEGTRYRIVAHEARAVRWISHQFLAGETIYEIAKKLNEGKAKDSDGPLDERTKRTRPTKRNPDGTPWIPSTLRGILMSPFCAALLPPKMPKGKAYDDRAYLLSDCVPGRWEAILEVDAVQSARGILLDSKRLWHDGTKAKWLLSKVGRCGKCGASIRSCKTKTTAKVQRGIRCTPGCFTRAAEPIEQYVEGEVLKLLSTPGLLKWTPDSATDIEALRGRQRALQFEREEAGRLWSENYLSSDMLKSKVDEVDRQLVAVETELADALEADPVSELVTSGDVHALWKELSTSRKRAALSALASRVDIFPVGKGRRVLSKDAIASTVEIRWKRIERRVAIERGAKPTAVPKIPTDAFAVVSNALNA